MNFLRRKLMGEKFRFNGIEYEYFDHQYNETKKKERAVEIPIAWDVVQRYQGKSILEVGNVLGHYFSIQHEVLDKYEISPGVINEDVTVFNPSKKYDLIMSISTLEHVGWEETPQDTSKIFPALNNLKTLLADGGELFMTIGLGQNNDLDQFIIDGKIKFNKKFYMKRPENFVWIETDENIMSNRLYNSPYCSANQLFIGIIYANKGE